MILLLVTRTFAELSERAKLPALVGELVGGLFSLPDPPNVIVQSLFSAIVIMAIVTTIATPVVLRLLWKR